MINKITSLENKIIKELVKIRDDSKYRHENRICFLEGERLINDTDSKFINSIFVNENYKKINELDKNKNVYILEDKVFNKIKNTANSQGIIATAIFNNLENIDELINDRFVLILDDIRDPGNLGTIIRTAEASGVDSIVINDSSCDIYMDKVIRASMSSIFRVKHYISQDLIKDLSYMKSVGFDIVGTKTDANTQYYDLDIKNKKIALVIGNEANGISNEIINLCDYNLKIEMSGRIESLNAAIATSIICFEIRKKINNEKIINN